MSVVDIHMFTKVSSRLQTKILLPLSSLTITNNQKPVGGY